MRRELLDVDRDGGRAAFLAERVAVAHMDGHLPAQVRQRERRLPVAAVGCAEQRKERLILIDRQGLSVAQRPALRGEVKTHDFDLTQERFGHSSLLWGLGLKEQFLTPLV